MQIGYLADLYCNRAIVAVAHRQRIYSDFFEERQKVIDALRPYPKAAHYDPLPNIATNRSNKYKLSCGPGLASG